MPHLHLLIATGTAQRRLVASEIEKLTKKGYVLSSRQDGGEWGRLLTENRGGGLFSSRSIIVVEEAEKLGALPEQLVPLLEDAGASVIILIVCKSETPVIVPKAHIGRCTVSKAAELSPWSRERDDIVQRAAKKHGVTVDRDALLLLKELFDDTGELEGETEKLALSRSYKKKSDPKAGGAITAADVEILCLSDGSRSLLKLLDGLCAGKYADCLVSLEYLKEGELLPLVSALYNRFRLAFYVASFPEEKGFFLKALGARDYAARLAEGAAGLYGKERLMVFLVGLMKINANEKSGMGASWHDLDVLVTELLSGASGK